MTKSSSVAKVPAQPACKRRLAGSWDDSCILPVEAWIRDSTESPPSSLASPEVGLPFRHFDDTAWSRALRSFRGQAQKHGITQGTLPDFVWEGLKSLRLTHAEPSLAELNDALRARAGFTLVLMPQPLDWKLEMAFLAQKVVPVVPFLGTMDNQGRVDVADLRRYVCGLLPLLVGDLALREFVWVFARAAAKTESKEGTEFLMRLWHASMVMGIVQMDKGYKPYGMDLITDRSGAAWACDNASTPRRLLTLSTLKRTPLAELQARDGKTTVFMISSDHSPLQVLKDFLRDE